MFQRISGGSSETELKLLAVMPQAAPAASVHVTTVTPVANRPRHWRKEILSLMVCAAWVGCSILTVGNMINTLTINILINC